MAIHSDAVAQGFRCSPMRFGLSAYGGLRDLQIDDSRVTLRLDAFAANDLGIAEVVELDLRVPSLDMDRLREHLQLVLGDHAAVDPR